MSVPATIEQPAAPAPAKPARERRISRTLVKTIACLEDGTCDTQKAAAERNGLSEGYLSRALKQVHVQAFIARRRAENIAAGSLRASRRFVQLVDAESEHVAAKVCERILVTTGDLKSEHASQVSVNVDIKAGYVIRLAAPGTHTAPQQIEHAGAQSLTAASNIKGLGHDHR